MGRKLSNFDPEKNYIISVSKDKIYKWDADSGECVQKVTAPARSVSISADGNKIMYMLNKNKIFVYSIGSWFSKTFLGKRFGTTIHSAAISPDGQRIAACCDDGYLRVWDINTPEDILRSPRALSPIETVSFSSDGTKIAYGYTNVIKVCDNNLNEIKTFRIEASNLSDLNDVISVSFSPDNRYIVCGHSGGLDVYNFENDNFESYRETNDPAISSASFSPDGQTIVAAGPGNDVHVMNLDCDRLKTLTGHTSPVTSVLFSADGKHIVSGSLDNTVRIWDANSGVLLNTLEKHTGAVTSIAYVGRQQSAVSQLDVGNNGLQLRF